MEEEEDENIREKAVNIFVELMEQNPEEVDKGLDQVFRLRSFYAEKNKIPRDVLVNVLTKKMKEEILRQSYKNPIEFKGKRIFILRELPKQLLADRKKYRKLTEELKKKNVKFRWELPEGLSFSYEGERRKINSEDQMEKFLQEFSKKNAE